jgi:hypothetical protein
MGETGVKRETEIGSRSEVFETSNQELRTGNRFFSPVPLFPPVLLVSPVPFAKESN